MTKWNDTFKDDVVAELNRLVDELHLEPAEAGEDEVLATAVVAGLTRPGSVEPVVLGIVGREEGISIEARNVCFAGSPGANANRTVSYILGHIFAPRDEDDASSRDQIELCGVLADLFRSANRTTDDLVAMIVAASNGVMLRTTAAVDFRDGEVVVDTFLPCDANTMPEDFESGVGRVLQHAALIQRTARVVRDLLSPDQVPAPRTMQKLFEKLRSREKNQDGETAEREAVEEVTL